MDTSAIGKCLSALKTTGENEPTANVNTKFYEI